MHKKRIISCTLLICMLLSVFSPLAAFAGVINGGWGIEFDGSMGSTVPDGASFGEYTVVAPSSGLSIDTSNKNCNGSSYTHRLKLGASGSYSGGTLSGAGLTFSTSSAGVLVVHSMSSSSTVDRTLKLSSSGIDIEQSSIGSGLTEQIYGIPNADSYALYSVSGGINLYYVDFISDSARLAWPSVAVPSITNISTSNNKITVDFSADIGINGADEILVSLLDDSTNTPVSQKSYSISGGNGQVEFAGIADGSYKVLIESKRASETTVHSITSSTIVFGSSSSIWQQSVFGESTSLSKNIVTDNLDGSVTISSMNNGGKFLTSGADGINYYFTQIPKTDNFELSAKITVNEWTYTNGQEGFAVMVRDVAGTHNTTTDPYSNSFAFMASKVEYLWDTTTQKPSDAGDEKISMKIGAGTRTVTGITTPNFNSSANQVNLETSTLDVSCASYGTGSYNIVGNSTSSVPGTKNNQTDFYVTIKKTNTGFHILYTDLLGNQYEEIMYNWEDLYVIDPNNVCVGFAAARNMKITVSNISLTTSNAATDPPAQPRPTTNVTPNYSVTSSKSSGISDYVLRFLSNADGNIDVMLNGSSVDTSVVVSAGTEYQKSVKLKPGENNFTITFKPDPSYKPSLYSQMSDYNPVTITHKVEFKNYGKTGEVIYVSPTGLETASGNIEDPMDIYTAVKFVQPGQTIILLEGIYNLTEKIYIPRGNNGTVTTRIQMIADPNSNSRPVLNFSKKSSGIEHWGDYWYFRGFDVTNTGDMQKGIQVAGNNNVFDLIETYNNGNTGLQISGISSEPNSLWPSNNLILNCTSYNNSDIGREDADGFAAKITCGSGNVFDGCISYNNADDGWDFFAKAESGSIGKVTIKNSVAYSNGFLSDGSDAGNGNGFKMGGTSMPGDHELINSISFDNKAKGIDSNSCPDIQVKNSSVLNNESYNVAFYTNVAPTTNFRVDGLISMRTQYMSIKEQIKLSQSTTLVYGPTNFYWDETVNKSLNSTGVEMKPEYFVSLDTSVKPTRYADGSIDVHGLLQLKDIGKTAIGLNGSEFYEGLSPSWTYEIGDSVPAYTETPSVPSGSFVSRPSINNYDPDENYTTYEAPTANGNKTNTGSNIPTINNTSVEGNVKDKVASFSITESMVKDAIKEAESRANINKNISNGIALQFNLIANNEYNDLAITIDASALKQLKLSKVRSILLNSSQIELTFDANAINEIILQSDQSIILHVKKQGSVSKNAYAYIQNRPVFDITIKDSNNKEISNFKNGTVVIGLTYYPSKNENTGNLYGVYIDSKGNPVLLNNSSYKSNKVFFKRNSLSVYGVGYKDTSLITDIGDHWAKNDVEYVVSRQWLDVQSKSTFNPDKNITRGEFITALLKSQNVDVSKYTNSRFNDIESTNPYSPYIEWAVENKIINEISSNNFGINKTITNEEISNIIQIFANKTNIPLIRVRKAFSFADKNEFSDSLGTTIQTLYQAGIINPDSIQKFYKDSNVTRAQASYLLRRLTEYSITYKTSLGWTLLNDGNWMYYNNSGNYVLKLNSIDGKYYYFSDKGIMSTAKWVEIEGDWYYFTKDGSMAIDTVIGDKTVDKNGKRL